MIRVLAFNLALLAAILAVLVLSAGCREQIMERGGNNAINLNGLALSYYDFRGGRDHWTLVGTLVDNPGQDIGFLRPSVVWPTGVKSAAARVTGRVSQTRGVAGDSEVPWQDPLLTHHIFVGRDGPVLISREITPDADFWAGVGVAGCESEWRATVDSPTGDKGFWQLNRRWQEWRFLRRGWTWEDAKDPEKNTEIAYEIFLEQSWRPWSTRDCVGRSMGTSGEC